MTFICVRETRFRAFSSHLRPAFQVSLASELEQANAQITAQSVDVSKVSLKLERVDNET